MDKPPIGLNGLEYTFAKEIICCKSTTIPLTPFAKGDLIN
jgi:hypothetical protein